MRAAAYSSPLYRTRTGARPSPRARVNKPLTHEPRRIDNTPHLVATSPCSVFFSFPPLPSFLSSSLLSTAVHVEHFVRTRARTNRRTSPYRTDRKTPAYISLSLVASRTYARYANAVSTLSKRMCLLHVWSVYSQTFHLPHMEAPTRYTP